MHRSSRRDNVDAGNSRTPFENCGSTAARAGSPRDTHQRRAANTRGQCHCSNEAALRKFDRRDEATGGTFGNLMGAAALRLWCAHRAESPSARAIVKIREATMTTETAFDGVLCGHAVLIVEPTISAAADLQDALAETGARIWTAYTFERACMHAATSQLSAAITSAALSPLEKKKLSDLLSERSVPFVVSSENKKHRHGDVLISPVPIVHRIVSLVRSNADANAGRMENMWTRGSGGPTALRHFGHGSC